METIRVDANGVRFACLAAGDGPLVLLLHGFPDDARTFEPQIEALAAAGYRAVAPFMRGYPPTETPGGAFFDTATLTADAHALIEALGGGPALAVGHDWGAFAAYGLATAFPSSVRRVVTMAIPHPGVVVRFGGSYEQIRRSFYIWFFQLPHIPEVAVALDDMAFIERLWAEWSPGHEDNEHLADVKATLSQPGALEGALGYYRALFDPARQDPALADVRARLGGQARVPTLYLHGADDGCIGADLAEGAEGFFDAEYRVQVLPGCGHFLHRERPDTVNELLLGWLRA